MKILLASILFSVFSLQSSNSQGLYFKVNDLSNATVGFTEVKGSQLTLFDFWATWCKPCMQLMPKLNELSGEIGSEEFKIVGVSIDDMRSINKVKPLVKSLGVEYQILLDPDQSISEELNVTVIPAMVLVNEQGEILWTHEGYTYGDEKLIREVVQKYLK